MKLSSKVQALTELIAPAVAACDVALWGVEFRPQGKRSLLRVYIDLAANDLPAHAADTNAPKSVGVDDCKRVSHQVSGLLDVHDPIAGEYVLEVSSPGWDRQFFSAGQMQDYIGETIALRLIHAVDNRRKITATLLAVSDTHIDVAMVENTGSQSEQTMSIAINNIDKANLVYQES